MLIGGAAQTADRLPWKPWRRVLGSNLKVIFGLVFEASPAHLGLRFSVLATSAYLGFWRGLEASYVCCQEGKAP